MKNKGFTMVELLAVIIILGLLVSILFPTIRNAINKNKRSLYNEQLDEIVNAAKLYGSDNMKDLPGEIGDSHAATIYVGETLINGGYIEQMKNPFTDKDLVLCSTTVTEKCISVKVTKTASRKWKYEISDTTDNKE